MTRSHSGSGRPGASVIPCARWVAGDPPGDSRDAAKDRANHQVVDSYKSRPGSASLGRRPFPARPAEAELGPPRKIVPTKAGRFFRDAAAPTLKIVGSLPILGEGEIDEIDLSPGPWLAARAQSLPAMRERNDPRVGGRELRSGYRSDAAGDEPSGLNGTRAAAASLIEARPPAGRERIESIRGRIERGRYLAPLILRCVARRLVESGDLDPSANKSP